MVNPKAKIEEHFCQLIQAEKTIQIIPSRDETKKKGKADHMLIYRSTDWTNEIRIVHLTKAWDYASANFGLFSPYKAY